MNHPLNCNQKQLPSERRAERLEGQDQPYVHARILADFISIPLTLCCVFTHLLFKALCFWKHDFSSKQFMELFTAQFTKHPTGRMKECCGVCCLLSAVSRRAVFSEIFNAFWTPLLPPLHNHLTSYNARLTHSKIECIKWQEPRNAIKEKPKLGNL